MKIALFNGHYSAVSKAAYHDDCIPSVWDACDVLNLIKRPDFIEQVKDNPDFKIATIPDNYTDIDLITGIDEVYYIVVYVVDGKLNILDFWTVGSRNLKEE